MNPRSLRPWIRGLKWAGMISAGLAVALMLFYVLFVYPRPGRLPDPLAVLDQDEAAQRGGLRIAYRLADEVPSNQKRSADWSSARSALAKDPDAVLTPDPGGLRVSAGIGLIKRGEMEAIPGLFAPTPTDLSYIFRVPDKGRLALSPAVFGTDDRSSARFTVRISDADRDGMGQTLMDRQIRAHPRPRPDRFWPSIREYLEPDIRGKYGGWEQSTLDLSRWGGRTVRLTLSTSDSGSSEFPVPAVWGNPVVLEENRMDLPNILVILVDAMRPDAMGVYGSLVGATPNMDRLAREGTIFRWARSASTDTRTSETALLTGRYPGEIGLHYRKRGLSRFELEHFFAVSPDRLPEHLGRMGYVTAAFANNPFLLEFSGIGYDLGFDLIYHNNRSTLDTVDLTDRAIRWLAQAGRRPFFLFLNYNSPHGLYRPPIKNLLQVAGLREIAGYDRHSWYHGSVAYVDEYIGLLRTALERLGLLDNTLIVITADHGQVFSPHHDYGLPDSGLRTFNRHGYTLYDEEIRVPLIFRLPGPIPADRMIEDPVSLVDVFPTIAAVTGIPVPSGLPGQSLVPLLSGDPIGVRPIYAEGRYMKAIVKDGYKYIYREPPARGILRAGPAGERRVHVREELYDLERDPDERNNLAASEDEPDRIRLRDMRALARRTMPPSLMLNHVRLVSGPTPHSFSGRVSLIDGSGGRIRFISARPSMEADYGGVALLLEGDRVLRFGSDLAGGRSAGFLFETDPPGAGFRLDITMDGDPISPDRLLGGPMGLPGLIRPGEPIGPSDLAWLGSAGGILKSPVYDPRNETAVFLWRTGYLDYVTSAAERPAFHPEVREILLDWGYIQKDEGT